MSVCPYIHPYVCPPPPREALKRLAQASQGLAQAFLRVDKASHMLAQA